MTDAERLKQGVAEWNKWRFDNPDLYGVDLSGADLSGADLSGVNLSGADLYGVDLRRVLALDSRWIFTASSGSGYQMVLVDLGDKGISIQAGCRRFNSEAAAREHWRDNNGHDPDHLREVLAALDYLLTMARGRGWAAFAEKKETT